MKNVLGPLRSAERSSSHDAQVVFEYTDAFSVFDWGRMPDLLPRKGEALAVLAAHWFEQLAQFDTWKEFSRTPEALTLRKANPFGALFNEIGESLQSLGLRTHYRGVLPGDDSQKQKLEDNAAIQSRRLADLSGPTRFLVVQQVSIVKPRAATVLGRSIPDYGETRQSRPPKLVPLEVVFRWGCPEGSSLIERAQRDPEYLASLGFPTLEAKAGAKWDFPVLELFTKLEATDRPVSWGEALAISGLSAEQLQELMMKTAWVSGFLRAACSRHGLELADGKLEWGIDADGQLILVDAVGPDELRILSGGIQLSKEFLRAHYRTTAWYEAITRAKSTAKYKGSSDWKRFVPDAPPALPPAYRELATQVYLSLTNALTGRKWFADAWSLEKVIAELREKAGSA